MKMKKFMLIFIGVFLINSARSQTASPELISSGGESFENATYQLDWSTGEIAVETYTQGSYTLTQGFHQDTYTVTALDELLFSDVKITAYPNPVNNFITIKNPESLEKELSIELSDTQGKIYLNDKFSETKKQINLEAFSSGIYFLNIKSESVTIKTFKIIKK